MRLTPIAPAAFFCALLPGIVCAQADHSVGVPRYQAAAPASWRFLYGMGGNLGQMNEAPSTTLFRATYQSSNFFYGIGEVTSTGSGPSYAQPSVSEFDFLIGFSWDETIPLNQRPPVLVHYALASGIAVNTYTHIVSNSYFDYGYGYDTYTERRSEAAAGLPIQFSMVYEPFKFAGIGAVAFLNVSRFTPSYGGAVMLEARF